LNYVHPFSRVSGYRRVSDIMEIDITIEPLLFNTSGIGLDYKLREVIKLEKVRLERFYCTKFRVYPTSYSKFVHENFTINLE
jgi:hypothetical protein